MGISTIGGASPIETAGRSVRGRGWLRSDAVLVPLAAVVVGLSSFLSSHVFVEAYTREATRGKKRELATELLPAGVLASTAVATLALGVAARRAGSFTGVLVRPGGRPLALRAAVGVLLALVLALSTPLLQAALGLDSEPGWSRLVQPAARIPGTALALLGAALQEDVLLRVAPIEAIALVAGTAFGYGAGRARAALVVGAAVSVWLAFWLHGAPLGGAEGIERVVAMGLPKVPAAIVFACVYLRRGLVETVLLHASTNLAILLVVPLVAGGAV